MRNFARDMVERFKMGDHARFGIIQFDTIAKFPIRMETYNDAEMLKVHIQKLLMNPFGKRRTDDALKVARDDLFRTARAGVRRAMIIVTNGRANGMQQISLFFFNISSTTNCISAISPSQLMQEGRGIEAHGATM